MPLTDEPDEKLMRALDFNLEDLKANRRHQLTTRQRRSLRRWQVGWILFVSVVLLMLDGLIILRNPSPGGDIFSVLLIPIVPAVLWSIWFYRRVEHVLTLGRVASYRGEARFTNSFMIKYRRFAIPRGVFVNGRIYTVYYVPRLEQMVSAEEYVHPKQAAQERRQKRQHEAAAESEYQD